MGVYCRNTSGTLSHVISLAVYINTYNKLDIWDIPQCRQHPWDTSQGRINNQHRTRRPYFMFKYYREL